MGRRHLLHRQGIRGDAGIMHGEDGLGLRRDGRGDQRCIEVERVRADIDEHRRRPAQGHRRRRADEGVGRQDDFVPRPDLAEQGAHLQRAGAGMGEQRLAAAGHGLQALLGLPRESAMALEPPVLQHLLQELQFRARQRRTVEGDVSAHAGRRPMPSITVPRLLR